MRIKELLILFFLLSLLFGIFLPKAKAQDANLINGIEGKVIEDNEIIIGDRGDYIWGFEDKSGGYVVQFHTGYEKWDELITCDINGDGKDEIIQGDRSTDKVYIYDMYGNELRKWDVHFESGDDLACAFWGYVDEETGEVRGHYRLYVADRSRDRIIIIERGLMYVPGEGDIEFEYGDSITGMDANGDGISDEIILADHDENELRIMEDHYMKPGFGYEVIVPVTTLDIDKYFDLTERDEVSAGDVNFDGKPELVIATQDNDNSGEKRGIHVFSIEYKNNAYSLKELSYFPISFKKGDRMVVGDVNSDGLDEIVWASQDDGRVRVYDMEGNLLNGPNGLKTEFTYGAGLAVGDVNGDSIVVGPPNKATLHVVNQVIAVINSPPVDYDAINETGKFYAEYTSKQTEESVASIKSTHDVKLTIDLRYKQGMPGLLTTEAGLKTSLGYKLQRERGEVYETAITQKMLADMADGAIYVSTDYDLYEFPIISPPELAVVNGKRQYILVSIPKGPPNVHFESYDSALHEIGDINTYPTRITDLKNYEPANVLGMFTIEASDVQSSYEHYTKQLNWEGSTNTFSVGVSLYVKASLGSRVIAGVEGSVQGDYGYEKVTTHEVKFSDETSVLVAYGGRIEDRNKWYNATGVIYTDSEDGHLVLDFYVPSKGIYYEQREQSPIFINMGFFKINFDVLRMINKPPECSINATPSTGKMPLHVGFNLHLNDPENGSMRWEINFGDGYTLEGNYTELRHVYEDKGTFPVTLTVYDPWNANSTCTATINVQHNEKPNAFFSYSPSEIKEGEEVSFMDSSTDPDGSVAGWSWNFGDGTFSSDRNPKHVYSTPGTYTVMLTVEDESGLKGSYTKEIKVEPKNYLPTADFTFLPKEPKAGEEVSFADKSTDRDGSIVSWSWDFGDGSTSTDSEPSHVYANGGNYTVTLTVRDDKGGEDVKRVTITVKEAQAPTPTETTTTSTPSETTTSSPPSPTPSTPETTSSSPSPSTTSSSTTQETSSTSPTQTQTSSAAGGTCGVGLLAILSLVPLLLRRRR
ncbi:PKD domain-containing protein [Thermococcus alcaliphilus]|nr:PKD domain-containing protein [Thermococcus alcaliphilus]